MDVILFEVTIPLGRSSNWKSSSSTAERVGCPVSSSAYGALQSVFVESTHFCCAAALNDSWFLRCGFCIFASVGQPEL